MLFWKFAPSLLLLLNVEVTHQVSGSRRSRCEDKVALQAEIRTLQESQELLRGEVDDLKTSLVSIRGLVEASLPEDCSAAQARGSWSSTVMIKPPGLPARLVRCDQREHGGGWTVILSRRPTANPIDFNTTWQDYRDGFGNIDGEFWIGNEVLHALTKEVPHHLRVVITDWKDVTRTATWSVFMVSSEENFYKLGIDGYLPDSTASDELKIHNGHAFSTHDFDNDEMATDHCAQSHGGGWWYFRCFTANPTGTISMPHEDLDHGMVWGFGRKKLTLKSITMMIKPPKPAAS